MIHYHSCFKGWGMFVFDVDFGEKEIEANENKKRCNAHKNKKMEKEARCHNLWGKTWSEHLIEKVIKKVQGICEKIPENINNLSRLIEEKYEKLETEIDKEVQKRLNGEYVKKCPLLNEDFLGTFLIFHQWHDLLLNIDITLKRQFCSDYEYSFDCVSFTDKYFLTKLTMIPCNKCKSTKKSLEQDLSSPSEESKNKIKNKKPQDNTLDDLVADMEYLEDED